MTMPDPIQPKQPKREFKLYSGNFLNVCLTARTWPLVTSICLVHQKTTLVAKRVANDKEVETMVQKWLKQQPKYFYVAGFYSLAKQWDKCSSVAGGYVKICFSRFEYHMFYMLYPFVTY
jgi:hypothetical protein